MSISPEHAADIDQLKRALGAIQRLRSRLDEVESARQGPVAIVGIGCRLPGDVTSPSEFWQLLSEGVDAVDVAPTDRWNADTVYNPDPAATGTLRSQRGGFVSGVDGFDPGFFGISPREAHAMDPQQRLALATAWEALEDAGIPPDSLAGSNTGVFIGIGLNDYARLQQPAQHFEPAIIDTYSITGNALCITANRLSYLLDLRGPSMAIDTACSSSLVAVHQAVQSLRRGESDLALVGGTNMLLAPETSMSVRSFLSPDGQCRFGDAGANGYVRGEGAIMIVLKLLSRAEADGDLIYAVIRGSAVNQDGFSSGLTVPNGLAQQAVLRDALRDAGVRPEQIGYVEAHGTGTALGDPIEIQALSEILVDGSGRRQPLPTGSVKTNIGHLEAGAGIAGLVKAALSIHEGLIPPSLHYDQPNPNIDFDTLGVQIQTELVPWPEGDRFASVSSFGFGGTNAHAILQSPPAMKCRTPITRDGGGVLLLSAKSESALPELASRYVSWIAAHRDIELADILRTAALGRSHHEFRMAVPATTARELRETLDSIASGGFPRGASRGQAIPGLRPKIAFLFTGQGSQYAGMGQELYATAPVFREALDQCATLLADQLERPLLDVLFAAPDSPEAALLDETRYTQPALFALEYALAQLWQAWGVRPAAVAGHSLGEYVAACVAGALSLEDALALVAARGRLMGSLPAGGSMAAVFAPVAEVRRGIVASGERVAVAAVNGPSHTVISGTTEAVEAVSREFVECGVRVRALTVSHAFHSHLMEPVLDAFEAEVRQVTWQPTRIPLVSNVTGELWPVGTVPDTGYWRRQMREAVAWGPLVEQLLADGYGLFLELGPQPVLSGMGSACTGGEAATWLPSLRSSDPLQLYKTLGGLYTSGVPINLKSVFEDMDVQRLRLPTYPWQNERYWFEEHEISAGVGAASARNRLHPLIDRRVRTPSLREAVYEADINLQALPYLDDHRAHQTALVPATAMLEMVVAAGREYTGRAYEVDELIIREPLPISEGESRIVQTILQPDDDELRFEVISSVANDEWRIHAAGRLSVMASSDEPMPGFEIDVAPQGNELDVDGLYERLDAIGMQYGPAFRGISRLYRDGDTVLGQVTLPAAAGDVSDYIIHPALLDACVQVAGALIPESEDVVYLPMSLEGVAFHGSPDMRLWSRATTLPASDDATLVCTFDIFNDDGERVASVRRAVFRRATQAALAAAIGKLGADLPLYEIAWREAPLTQASATAGTGRWLVLGNTSGIGCNVASILQDRGHQVDLIEPQAGFSETRSDLRQAPATDTDYFRGLLREVAADSDLRGVVYFCPVNDCVETAHTTDSVRGALEGALHLTQALASEMSVPLWFVTQGAQPAGGEVTNPAQAALWGLARTLRREHPELRPVCVDLDPGNDPALADALVAELFANDDEQEVALRSGTRFVGRIIRHSEPPRETPVRLEIAERGAIDGLEVCNVTRRQPGPGEVEIRVRATGLNFRDVLNTLGLYPDPTGQPGSECAGIVSAIGPDVSEFAVGDLVVAMADDSFATYALAPAALTARLPGGISFAEAATLPIAFVTAAYSLRHLAGIQPGMRVLIHSATGGVGLGALQIARASGAEIFATAGSDVKRDYLRSLGVKHVYDSRSRGFAPEIREATGGQGVDIVLNSLTGELIPESLEALRDGGCFLEIGKNGIWSAEEVAALGRDIVYHPIYVGALYESDPELIGGILNEICVETTAGSLSPLPLSVYPFERAVDAFRLMAQARHIGKVVVTQDSRSQESLAVDIRQNASYLITGGLGGVGLELARWLVERGARSIVLTGRSQPSDAARTSITELERAGAQILVVPADMSDEDDVTCLFATIDEQALPLAGVIHAAGTLDDGILAQQDWSRFERVFAPKLDGAWFLHERTAHRDLDFFVLFSAGAALIGNPGQANYAAANAAVDALAHWRHARGLPAVSINWGPWGEVGMAAGINVEVQRRLSGQGFQPLATDDGLRGLEAALASGVAQFSVLPIDWERFAATFAPATPPSLFQEVSRKAAVDLDGGETGEPTIVEILAATPASLRRSAVLRFVREQAAHVLGAPSPDAVPAGRPLSELGLDSLMAVEVRNLLGRVLDMQLPTTLLFDFPTPDALADYLLGCLVSAEIDDDESPATEAAVVFEGLRNLDLASLSDEEAEHLLLAELGDE